MLKLLLLVVWGTASWVAATPQRATIVFVDRAINTGIGPVDDFEVRLALPQAHPQQTVATCELLPPCPDVTTDKWGRRVARYTYTRLNPGEIVTHRWIVRASLHPWRVKPTGSAEAQPQLSPELRALYLTDAEKYQLQQLQALAQRVAPDGRSRATQLGLLFDYVLAHLRYKRDERFVAAPAALSTGTGSCSEYSFALIALCRARGIPARYVGGTACRSDSGFYVDRIGHRWVEAYLPRVGWVPLDPTRSDATGKDRTYFGRSPSGCLVISSGDGGADSLLNWQTVSYHAWPAAKGEVRVSRHGWWLGPTPKDLESRVLDWVEQLRQARTAADKHRLITAARSLRTRFVMPWLDDLLYDPEVRLQAARGMRDIGGEMSIVAIAESLERSGDPRGDQQIGRYLDAWTGEALGPSHQRWETWLSSSRFRRFVQAGEAGAER